MNYIPKIKKEIPPHQNTKAVADPTRAKHDKITPAYAKSIVCKIKPKNINEEKNSSDKTKGSQF